jgi:hypothetical protein
LGYYSVPLLAPGTYKIIVSANGFQTTSLDDVTVSVGQSLQLDFKLKVGPLQQKVVVQGTQPIIEPSNPNASTVFTSQQLGALPNPGSDLTYIANLIPGAVMNTAMGASTFGNTEYNGLPSLSNYYSMDGLSITDSYIGTNIVGVTGLTSGLNAVDQVSVNTEAYSADHGRKGAAQIDYITKSGTNSFHGNMFETWNGSRMNARNFFLNADPSHPPKPRTNVNLFGASLGGPLIQNHLFFFLDFEGTRLVLPNQQFVVLPTPAYQTYVLQQLPLGGVYSPTGETFDPQPAEVPFYQKMFQLFGDTSRGTPLPLQGCPFDVGGGAPGVPDNGDGCANQRVFTTSPFANATLFTFKLDYNPHANDSYWFRVQLQHGSSTGYVDAVNPIFNSSGTNVQRSAAAGWTHIFGANLVNQFNPGIFYYLSEAPAPAGPDGVPPFPITYFSPFSPVGGIDYQLPQGYYITQWQLNDSLSWSHGRHELRFGAEFRQSVVSDLNYIAGNVPQMYAFDLPEFTYGVAGLTQQIFPPGRALRESYVNLDGYAMDTWKITSKWTVTLGLRLSWNSNLVNSQHSFARLNSETFDTLSHDPNRPLDQDILTNQRHLYGSTPLLAWQPRVALAYSPRVSTVFRAGFGVFTEVLDGIRALASGASNPPYTNVFYSGLGGSVPGSAIAPGVPKSAFDAAVAANHAFQQGFATGALSCAASNPPPNCLPPIGFSGYPNHMTPPNFYEWSLGVEQQFGNTFRVGAKYVGTRMVHALIPEDANGSQTVCEGCFRPYSFEVPPDPRFANVVQWQTSASSSYHGLQLRAEKRFSHGFQFLANYTWSHCLSTTANDGWTGFGRVSNSLFSAATENVQRMYGNCDFDVQHSLNGSVLYEFPFHSSRSWVDKFVSGWQIAGTVFYHSGFPFTVYSASIVGGFPTATSIYFANRVSGQKPYTRSDIPGVTLAGTIQWLNPSAFQSTVDPSTNTCYPTTDAVHCQDGDLARNSLRAPDFRWGDLNISKRIKISDRLSFKFETQFYNLFNHPNFGFPIAGVNVAGIPGNPSTLLGVGTIHYTTAPPTGLLGGSGGDSSVRMVALRGTIEF